MKMSEILIIIAIIEFAVAAVAIVMTATGTYENDSQFINIYGLLTLILAKLYKNNNE